MLGPPFRFLARLGRAVRVTSRGNADRPAAIDIFLAFHHQDRAPQNDRFVDLVFAIEHASVGAAGAPPPAVALAVTDAEARLVAFRIAHLLKAGIIIGRSELAALAVALAVALTAAFRWPTISAVMTVPRRALVIDLDAHTFGFLMRWLARVRALRADRRMIAEVVVLKIDIVCVEQLLRGHRAPQKEISSP